MWFPIRLSLNVTSPPALPLALLSVMTNSPLTYWALARPHYQHKVDGLQTHPKKSGALRFAGNLGLMSIAQNLLRVAITST